MTNFLYNQSFQQCLSSMVELVSETRDTLGDTDCGAGESQGLVPIFGQGQ